jgi:hypothetical protein
VEGVVIDTNVFVAAGFNSKSAAARVFEAVTDRFRTPQRPLSLYGGNRSSCRGFRMTAPSRAYPRAPGPSSESLQGRNPRDVGRSVAAGSMGISTRPLRMRPLMTWRAEWSRNRAVVATGLGWPGNKGRRPIRDLRGAGSDERCRGQS